MVTKINLAEKFSRFTDEWSPKIVADLNDSHVKLAKVQGESCGTSTRTRSALPASSLWGQPGKHQVKWGK